jgi:hypothetical protein
MHFLNSNKQDQENMIFITLNLCWNIALIKFSFFVGTPLNSTSNQKTSKFYSYLYIIILSNGNYINTHTKHNLLNFIALKHGQHRHFLPIEEIVAFG